VDLRAENTLDAIIMGAPGSGYRVSVYGPLAGCGGAVDASVGTSTRVAGGVPTSLPGRRVLNIDGAFVASPQVSPGATAMGCSSTGGTAAGAGLFALLAFLFALRRPAPVRVRATRRRR
jgi:hypothetical protein